MRKVGDKISVERFHISKLNVRADEGFGESEEDQRLIANLRRGRVVQPFKARPEGDGYGVYVGRRRFLAKKATGAKSFVVGVDCLVEDVTDEEAREASLVENLGALRKDMNPVVRAKQLNELVSFSTIGLRGWARRLGVPASNLSDWLSVLKLSQKMQDAVRRELLTFTDAVKLVRLKLGEALQDELATVLEDDGVEAFWREVARVTTGKGKRGIPKNMFYIIRSSFDKRYKPDVELYEKLTELAKQKDVKLDVFVKEILKEYVKTA